MLHCDSGMAIRVKGEVFVTLGLGPGTRPICSQKDFSSVMQAQAAAKKGLSLLNGASNEQHHYLGNSRHPSSL